VAEPVSIGGTGPSEPRHAQRTSTYVATLHSDAAAEPAIGDVSLDLAERVDTDGP